MGAFLVEAFSFGGELLLGTTFLAEPFTLFACVFAFLLHLHLVVGGELDLLDAQRVVVGLMRISIIEPSFSIAVIAASSRLVAVCTLPARTVRTQLSASAL